MTCLMFPSRSATTVPTFAKSAGSDPMPSHGCDPWEQPTPLTLYVKIAVLGGGKRGGMRARSAVSAGVKVAETR